MSTDAVQSHYRACNLCEALCGIEVRHRDGEILSIRGDAQDPFSRGHVCPKAVALQDIQDDPDRLRHPVRRTKDGWERVSWEEAFDGIVADLRRVQQAHGPDALAVYVGNPTAHNHGALLMLPAFLESLGTRSRFSATSADQLPHMLACLGLFGNQALFPIPDLDHTDHFLCIGANPMASNGSVMTAGDLPGRLKAIRQRKGKVVVVDPRRTETAAVADAHHFIRPGTDALLLSAMIHELFAQRKVRPGRVAEFLDGIETLQKLVRPFSPEAVSPHCGIPADTIRALALEFAGARSAVAYCRVGTTTSAHAGLSAWLVYVLNVVTGNLDRRGGLMFPKAVIDLAGLAVLGGRAGHFDTRRSRVSGLPEFGGEWPVACLAEEILTPGDGQIRALVTHAGNPVLSTPDGRQLDAALSQLDFMVSIDIYINETTRHAHYILPPTGPFEHAQFDPLFHAVAVRNTVRWADALLPKPAGALHDWEVLLELSTRLASRDFGSTLKAKAARTAMRALGDEGLVDVLLRLGPYGSRVNLADRLDDRLLNNGMAGPLYARLRRQAVNRFLDHPRVRDWLSTTPYGSEIKPEGGLTLAKVKAHPHGLDIGPLEPCLPDRLATPEKTVQLVPGLYVPAMRELAGTLETAPATPVDGLLLVGRRHVRSNNSWLHNSRRLVKGKNRCTVIIHPQDAKARKIADGDDVEVSTRIGGIRLPAEVTDAIMPGVVSVPHGFGHDREGVQLAVARELAPGASLNDITDARRVDTLSGTSILNGVPVTVRRAKKPAGRG